MQRRTLRIKSKNEGVSKKLSHESQSQDTPAIKDTWIDLEIDAAIGEIMAVIAIVEVQPSQEPHSQFCNHTLVVDQEISKSNTPSKVKKKKLDNKKNKCNPTLERISDSLKSVCRSKRNVGPESTSVEPFEINNEVEEIDIAVPANEDPKLWTCVVCEKMKSCGEISRKLTQ